MNKIDTLSYKTFKRLKDKYSVKTVLLTDNSMALQGLHLMFKTHRDYIAHLFAKEGVEITRWAHNYESLNGPNPELGLIYLANDSAIVPGMEVHALMDHNARNKDKKDTAINGI